MSNDVRSWTVRYLLWVISGFVLTAAFMTLLFWHADGWTMLQGVWPPS